MSRARSSRSAKSVSDAMDEESSSSLNSFYKKTKKTENTMEKKDMKLEDEEEEQIEEPQKTTKKRRTSTSSNGKNSKKTAKEEDNDEEPPAPRKRKAAKNTSKTENNEKDSMNDETTKRKGDYVNREMIPSADGKIRCWSSADEEMNEYHDSNWGVPPALPIASPPSNSSSSRSAYTPEEVSPYISFSETMLNQLCLQLFQAGISWKIIFNKRHSISSAFSHYSFAKLPLFGSKDVERLLQDAGIIRNRRKVEAVINNAQQALRIEKRESQVGGFGIWLYSQSFVMQMPPRERKLASGAHLGCHMRQDGFKVNGDGKFESDGVHPTDSVTKMTQLLKSEGFKHLGETTVLSFMQAVGMMNHHADKCHIMEFAEQRWKQLMSFVKNIRKIK